MEASLNITIVLLRPDIIFTNGRIYVYIHVTNRQYYHHVASTE